MSLRASRTLRSRSLPGGRHVVMGLVDLDVDPEVLLHHFLDVIAGRLEHLQPAVLPVADACQPGRTTPARPGFSALSFEMQLPVPVEPLALPDLFQARIV